jgi:hypothetical protein
MTTAMTLASLACIFCVCATAAALENTSTVFACNLKAISPAERPRYNELLKRVRDAKRHRTEVTRGYSFKLDSKSITLQEAAEWIGMERLCCPFLTLQLSATGNQEHWILTLTGPKGVKPLLDAEFSTH